MIENQQNPYTVTAHFDEWSILQWKYLILISANYSFLKSSIGNQGDRGVLEIHPTSHLFMGKLFGQVFKVDGDLCFGCAACLALCPVDALEIVEQIAVVEEQTCTHCEHCILACPVFALSIGLMTNA